MSEYDEIRCSIYNRLDALSCSRRDEVVERISRLEWEVSRRERERLITLLRLGHSTPDGTVAYRQMADYLESLTADEERSTQDFLAAIETREGEETHD